ncbi:MAG TPA: DedA family protein [Bacillota bacterium]
MSERLAEWLTMALGGLGGFGIFLAMALESACVPIPSEVILPLAGILVGRGLLSFWGAVAWAVGGQMVGSTVAYLVGFYGNRPLLHRYERFILRRGELETAERWFKRHGELTVMVTRLLPGIRTFISLPAGIAAMPFWRFLAYSLVGAIPWTAFLIWAGLEVGAVWKNPGWAPFFRLAEVVVLLAVIVLVGLYIRQRFGGRGGRGRRGRAGE